MLLLYNQHHSAILYLIKNFLITSLFYSVILIKRSLKKITFLFSIFYLYDIIWAKRCCIFKRTISSDAVLKNVYFLEVFFYFAYKTLISFSIFLISKFLSHYFFYMLSLLRIFFIIFFFWLNFLNDALIFLRNVC